jgi:mercuric ion transport protein
MKDGGTRLLETGAIGSAVAASICCIGPLALALLGMGGGALLLKVAPYRPYFLAATALLLGGAFYFTYRRPVAEACAPGSPCALPASRTRQKIVLWFVTGIVVLAASFPMWSKALF